MRDAGATTLRSINISLDLTEIYWPICVENCFILVLFMTQTNFVISFLCFLYVIMVWRACDKLLLFNFSTAPRSRCQTKLTRSTVKFRTMCHRGAYPKHRGYRTQYLLKGTFMVFIFVCHGAQPGINPLRVRVPKKTLCWRGLCIMSYWPKYKMFHLQTRIL